MKELKLLTEWADSVINEFTKDGNLPLNQDPIRQTQIKYPHLSKDEAASKYLDDITTDFKDQNAVINAQSKKSEKLEKVVGDQNLTISKLNKEIDDIESNSNLQSTATNDKLKQIGNIKKISDEEHRKLVDKIDSLQNKPGMTDERYAELMKRVDDFQKNGVDPQKIKEFERRIESMSRQESVGKADFERIQALISKAEQNQAEVERGRGDINAKIAAVEKRQSELDQKEKEHEEKVKSTSWRNDPDAQKFVKAVGKRSKTTKQRVDDLIGNKNERLDNLKNLPARIDTLEPEVRIARELALDASDDVDKQEVINKTQDEYLDRHESELKRLGVGDFKPETVVKRRTFNPNVNDFDDMDYRERFNKNSTTKDGNKNVDYNSNDTKIRLGKTYSPIGNDMNIATRLKNILATLDTNGKPKSKEDRLSDIKRAKELVNNYKHMIDAKVSNQSATDTREKYNMMQRWAADQLSKLQSLVNTVADKANISPDLISIDHGFTGNYKRHLPESLSTELESLAENILGPQLAKYLK